MGVTFGVLGPVDAWSASGSPLALGGRRHRAVLARLILARGRVVPVGVLVEDLWEDPPTDPVGALRTFVAALRRALEPDRPPRGRTGVLVTEGPGYALRAAPDAVDAVRFERAVASARDLAPDQAVGTLDDALGWWRGPPYADVADEPWAAAERGRLTELRLHAVELRAVALLDAGRPAAAVPDLDAHVAAHPWREEGWRVLALALYRTGRQGDALDVLRRARALLVEELGVDPGPDLRRLEHDILHQVEQPGRPEDGWSDTAAVFQRTVGTDSRARLRSTVDLLRSLAVSGGPGLSASRDHRLATVLAAERTGDPRLAARVIGGYDVPAVWSRSDDPSLAAQVVAAARRTLVALGPDAPEQARARLLATIAVESRGDGGDRARRAAAESEAVARRLGDPALLAFALNGVFLQTFHRAGLARERDAIGRELVELSARHGLATSEVLGHLVRVQALSALGDLEGADHHAAVADRLGAEHESPLVRVFTDGYRALRGALTGGQADDVAAAYRRVAARLEGAGMPGLERGLLPLALLTLRIRHGQPAPVEDGVDWGPYEPWARPLVLLAQGRADEAARRVRAVPDPPADHLLEALWCLAGHAALAVGDRDVMRRSLAALAPAVGEDAGAGSGLLTVGPVAGFVDALAGALR